MTTFPLDTLACTINETGISAPSYADILTSLQTTYRSIYGADVDLDADTQDGQFLAILASTINDTNSATIVAFNAQSPSTAAGTDLSSIVKLNGLQREASSNSTADVTIIGIAGTIIKNGIIGDSVGLNTRWFLFPEFVIGDTGVVIVTATAEDPGNITAEPGTLTSILTPTIGWQSVTNVQAAFPGNPVESDATLRRRQSVSQTQAAQSPFSSALAAITNLPGVIKAAGYENPNTGIDANGVPGHSVSFVVGGGDVNQIAKTIERKKTIGTGTYGSTTIPVIDPSGQAININFFELTLDEVLVVINIAALQGFLSTTSAIIQQRVSDYIAQLPIGSPVYLSKIIASASLLDLSVNTTFDVTAVTLDGIAADHLVPFNQAADTPIASITINVG